MKIGLSLLLTLLVTLEIACQFAAISIWDKATNSVIYFIAGLFVALVPLIKVPPTPSAIKLPNWSNGIFVGLGIVSIVYLVYFLLPWGRDIFAYHVLHYKKADMLPVIAEMCQRFIQGEFAYKTLPFWGGTEPIYLPAMWLPYVPFSYFGLDIRWANLLYLLLGWGFIYAIGGLRNFSVRFLLLAIPIFVLYQNLFFEDYRLIYMTEEPMVIGYYLFLAFALSRKHTLLIGLALSFCLMSRFALVFWLLMYLGILLLENRTQAIKIASIIAMTCLLLLFATQAIWQLEVILGLPKSYLEHLVANEWKFNTFVNNQLGLLKFFDFTQLPTLHRLFFALSILLPAGCFIFYHYGKTKINSTYFALCSLKLCLVGFYNFLIMPFLYLFFTSTFLSLAILSWYLKAEPTVGTEENISLG